MASPILIIWRHLPLLVLVTLTSMDSSSRSHIDIILLVENYTVKEDKLSQLMQFHWIWLGTMEWQHRAQGQNKEKWTGSQLVAVSAVSQQIDEINEMKPNTQWKGHNINTAKQLQSSHSFQWEVKLISQRKRNDHISSLYHIHPPRLKEISNIM